MIAAPGAVWAANPANRPHTPRRVLRILLGLVLIGLAALGTIEAWGYLGIVPLLTGIAALCPVYRLFGMSTTSR